jgi:hypothetical protein
MSPADSNGSSDHDSGDVPAEWVLISVYVRLLNRIAACRPGSRRHTILARGLLHPRLAPLRRRYGLKP